MAQEWQRGGRRSTHQKAGVCVVFVVLVFFNFICTSPLQMTKCLRCREIGAAYMAHEAAIPRVSLHHTLGYPMTRTMIRFIIDNEAAIKAITSHRTLPVLKTFLDRKNTLLKYYSYIDRHRTHLCYVEVSKYSGSLRKSSHTGRHFLCKKRPRRTF